MACPIPYGGHNKQAGYKVVKSLVICLVVLSDLNNVTDEWTNKITIARNTHVRVKGVAW